MKNPWILVTGASGFIGGALVRKLVARGEKVKAFVRAGSSLAGLEGLPEDRFQIAVGDVTVEHTVYRALASASQLYHVAGAFEYGSRRPADVLRQVELGTRAVLEAARRRGIENIVVTSSSATLGTTANPETMDERHAFNLDAPDPYVAGKVRAAEIVSELVDKGSPVVSVLPTAVFGPGDRKPTPNGLSLLSYLGLSPAFSMPVSAGGISIVDVDDVVNGHIRAMEVGDVGARYILGGENVTFSQMFETLADITGLAEPSEPKGPFTIGLLAIAMELGARLAGKPPVLTPRLARDYAHSYVWVTSEKAEQELDYQHRPARETLARAVRWMLESGQLAESAAERLRLELRPA